MTQVPRATSKRTILSSTPMPVSAHGASPSLTRRTMSRLAGLAIDMGLLLGLRSGGQRCERIEVEGCLESRRGAQHHEVAVLGPDQLDPDREPAAARAGLDRGGGG